MTLVVCFLSFHYVLVYLLNFHYVLVYLLNYEFVDVWFLSQLYLKLGPGFNSILVPPLLPRYQNQSKGFEGRHHGVKAIICLDTNQNYHRLLKRKASTCTSH